MSEKESQQGHRERLRQRFIKSGISGLLDYEIVELLLTLGTPRSDCKQQAKKALERFKTFRGVLEAPLEELREIEGIGALNAFGVKLFQEISALYLKEKIIENKIVCNTSKVVSDYLVQQMAKEKEEVFLVLFLDAKNRLIESKELFRGSLISSAVYPRQIIKEALKYNAAGLIFSHNHPSGDPHPSESDKEITEDLVFSGNFMEIKVLDHIIIGNNSYFSFADEGFMEKYNLNFSGLKRGASK